MTVENVWYAGKHNTLEIGQDVTVFRLGGFLRNGMFGEPGKLVKATKQHLVFETESGAIVKTARHNLYDPRGRVSVKGEYSVKLAKFEDVPGIIRERVSYYDEKTHEFVNR